MQFNVSQLIKALSGSTRNIKVVGEVLSPNGGGVSLVTGGATLACKRALAQAGKMRRMSQQSVVRRPSAAAGGEVTRLSALSPTRLPAPGDAGSAYERAMRREAAEDDAAAPDVLQKL